MVKKFKYFILILFVMALFLPQSRLLALEVNYPPLTAFGAPDVNENPTLTNYILYFFILAVITAGAIGVISIVISGIQILLSAGSPTAVGAAKERILNSILGIILLMFSVVLLRTINPELITLQEPATFLAPGVYLVSFVPPDAAHPDGLIYKQLAPKAVADTSDPVQFDPSIQGIFYNCKPTKDNAGKTLLVWAYDETFWNIDRTSKGSYTASLPCGVLPGVVEISAKKGILSFSWDYEDSGVYYYLTDNCTGISTPKVQKGKDDIPFFDDSNEAVNDVVRSMRIVSGNDIRTRYGVILNKNFGGDGECSPPITNPFPGSICVGKGTDVPFPLDSQEKDFNPTYAYILTQDPTFINDNQITLRSEDYYVTLTDLDIGFPFFTYNGNPDTLLHPPCDPSDPTCPPPAGGAGKTYTGMTPIAECTQFDPNQPCLKRAELDGDFYVILYAKNDFDKNRACHVFENGFDGLGNQDFLSDGKQLYRMDIIPKAP